jgi:hypothetical protein
MTSCGYVTALAINFAIIEHAATYLVDRGEFKVFGSNDDLASILSLSSRGKSVMTWRTPIIETLNPEHSALGPSDLRILRRYMKLLFGLI